MSDTALILELSALRAIRTSENSDLLATLLEKLLSPPMSVRRYQHGQFLTLHDPTWVEAAPVKDHIGKVVEIYTAAGGCAVVANSFGFDFTVMSDVMDMMSGLFALRIAPSDEPAEELRALAAAVSDSFA